MDSSVRQYEVKLKKLLDKFLVPGYRLGNDIYLNILLSHLSGKDNQSQGEELRRLPIFSEWLEQAVVQWETLMFTPSPSISTFTVNLASLISANETIFINLNNKNVYVRLCNVLKLRSTEINPSVKLGYLKMLSSFMNHRAGLDWLAATECWTDVLSYCLVNQTIYITREGYNFIYELLNKFIGINETFCELIIKKMFSPLEADQFNRNGVIRSEIDDLQIQKEITPTLKIVTHVLEKCYLLNDSRTIPNIFLNKYNLESTLSNLLMIARDPEFILNISKLGFLVIFISIDLNNLSNKDTGIPILKDFSRKFSNLFSTLVDKRCAVNILKLCHISNNYWPTISKHLPTCEKKEPILFENQIIVFQIMPVLFITFSAADKNVLRDDELTELFINKLFKISCENTIRLAYAYRSLLMSSNISTAYDIGSKAIFYLMKMRENMHRDRAVIVFQALMYAMKYLTKFLINKNHTVVELKTYHISFLSALFDGLGMLIKDFKITWRESVESTCLTSLTLDFLNCPNLPTKLTVQTLQLMHLTIANFMPPNLALLVDEVNDSSVQTITPMLYTRLHDSNWEIRDSAFEILQTMVEISHLKFPAFQKMILDDRLCQLAVILCIEDTESFVRASGIKSITGMVKVPTFWTNSLDNEQLPEKMISVLQNESEAIVRCEAAKLICEMHEHQLIPPDIMNSIYITMSFAAIFDLHWEVKVNALTFWDRVIHTEMSNQGMIDGVFPTVTFSKEHRKIVILTEPEIQNRLNKALLMLSECGCLGVLISTIQDNCDLQVAKKAVEITKKLSKLLNKFNMLNSQMSAINIEPVSIVCDTFKSSHVSAQKETNSDLSNLVIDSIVNSNDISLLATVFKTQMKTTQVNGDVKDLKIVSPESFKSAIARDLDLLIDDRNRWLANTDDLGSLLDDILHSYEDNDVNNMDCY